MFASPHEGLAAAMLLQVYHCTQSSVPVMVEKAHMLQPCL